MGNLANVNIDKIRIRAKEQGKTLKFLCDKIGKRRSFLSEVSVGKDAIDEKELFVIAEELNTTTAYLCDETDQKNKLSDPLTEELMKAVNDDEQARELLLLLRKLSPEAKVSLLAEIQKMLDEQEKESACDSEDRV